MTTRRRGVARRSELWLAAVGAIFFGIAITGISIASFAQDVRSRFVALETNQRAQDALLAEYSRLLIERGTLSSYQNVDQVAARQLAMRFPELVERVAP